MEARLPLTYHLPMRFALFFVCLRLVQVEGRAVEKTSSSSGKTSCVTFLFHKAAQ